MAGMRLSLNAVGVQTGKRDVKAAFDEIKASARSMASGVDQAASKAEAATTRLGKAAKSAGGNVSKAGYLFGQTAMQAGDIAVQLEMGAAPLRVLGQQIPQIAGAFSILGGRIGMAATGIGLFAAVGFPLIQMLINMGDETMTAAERLEDVEGRLDSLKGNLKLAQTPLSELTEEFGIFAQGVKNAGDAAAEFDLYQAARGARELRDQLGEGLMRMTPLTGDFTAKIQQAAEALQSVGREVNGNTVSALANLSENLGITADEALPVYEALTNLREASTDTEMATAYTNLAQALFKLRPESDSAAQKIGQWATQSQSAGENMAAILKYMGEISAFGPLRLTVEGPNTPPAGGRGRTNPSPSDILAMRLGGVVVETPAARRAREARERAAASAARRERSELKRFADGIKPVLTLLQEYENNMSMLNEARQKGVITSEEFAVKEALLTQQFGIASGALADYDKIANRFADSLENSMMAMVDGTMSVQDAFKSMAVAVIKELFRIMVVQRAVNAIMGAFGYSMGTNGQYVRTPMPVPSGDGGGYTGDGARTGGLDGKGGFLTMLHPQETVVDHTKGQATGVVVNQTINVSAGVSQTVRAEMMNMLPEFRQQAQQGVLDAKRRGGTYRSAFA